MENNIYEMLSKMQSTMEEMNDRLKSVEYTVNRIEVSQHEDVVEVLKRIDKKTTNFE